MPELPEVETIVRDLQSLQGNRFLQICVDDPFVLRIPKEEFIRRLKGQSIKAIYRRGKAIVFELSSQGFLVVQVMMTGQLVLDGKMNKHTRIRFKLSNGRSLLYNDQRRFGQLRVIQALNEINYFNILGPEPFAKEFTPQYMYESSRKSQRPIKNLLLDHSFVAGIGNIYACEILFRSGVHPCIKASKLTKPQMETIYRHILQVLKEAIQHRGSSMRNYRDGAGQEGRFNQRLSVYAREGKACPKCRKPVLRLIQAGRSTFYCGHCQKQH